MLIDKDKVLRLINKYISDDEYLEFGYIPNEKKKELIEAIKNLEEK